MRTRTIRCLGMLLGLAAALLLPASARGQGDATLRCRLDGASVAQGQQATLIIELNDVNGLYGYQLELNYAPGLIRVQDADAGKEGANLALGSFVAPDFVITNATDEGAGKISLAVVQLNPSPPMSGSGELARAVVQGVSTGMADFVFGEVILSDGDGNTIAHSLEGCSLEVRGSPGTGPVAPVLAGSSLTPEPSTATPSFTATASPAAASPSPAATSSPEIATASLAPAPPGATTSPEAATPTFAATTPARAGTSAVTATTPADATSRPAHTATRTATPPAASAASPSGRVPALLRTATSEAQTRAAHGLVTPGRAAIPSADPAQDASDGADRTSTWEGLLPWLAAAVLAATQVVRLLRRR